MSDAPTPINARSAFALAPALFAAGGSGQAGWSPGHAGDSLRSGRAFRLVRSRRQGRAQLRTGFSSGTHGRAREAVRAGFVATFGREPTLPEAQTAQLIGWLESNYGRGWSDDPSKCPFGGCSGSHNWGAIITSPCPGPDLMPDCSSGFVYRDSYPDGSACYQCFRAYASAADGAQHLVKILYKSRPSVLEAASRGDLRAVAETMFDTTYYTGFGSTREEKIGWQLKRMARELPKIAEALGEPVALNGAGGLGAVASGKKKSGLKVGIAAAVLLGGAAVLASRRD